MTDEVGAHLIGRVATGHAFGKFTQDPVVTMDLWATDIERPGNFAMLPFQARILAHALLESAALAEDRGDVEALTQVEVERLETQAAYLGRQARNDLAALLRKAIALAIRRPHE